MIPSFRVRRLRPRLVSSYTGSSQRASEDGAHRTLADDKADNPFPGELRLLRVHPRRYPAMRLFSQAAMTREDLYAMGRSGFVNRGPGKSKFLQTALIKGGDRSILK